LNGAQAAYTPAQDYNGADSFTYVARDAASQSVPATVSITVLAVNDAPVANAGSDQTVEQTSASGSQVTLNGSLSKDADSTNPPALDNDILEYRWTQESTQLGTGKTLTVSMAAGDHTLTLTVKDSSGALSADQLEVRVRDTTAPTLIVPDDKTVTATNSSGAEVTYTAAIANDAVTASPSITYSHASGSMFPLGETNVIVTAKDAANNTTIESFKISVEDPVLSGVPHVFVRECLTLNGTLEGSVQLMEGNSFNLNNGATVQGDILVPGTPRITNRSQNYLGTIAGNGSTHPNCYNITLNPGSSVRHIRTRTNPIQLPCVPTPPSPQGTRKVTVSQPGQPLGDFATLRDLTLNSNAGAYAIPNGTYGTFIVNNGSTIVLGVAGSTTPRVYNFQELKFSGGRLQLNGPVLINVKKDCSVNAGSVVGSVEQPRWLNMKISQGGLVVNGSGVFHGGIVAPSGTVTVNGLLNGDATCKRLLLNPGGIISEP
jgi:rhamnogalacturonan endolyase